MSPFGTLFAYFGLYFLFMLIFFVILCVVGVAVILWYHRKEQSPCECYEETPIRRDFNDIPSSSRNFRGSL